MKALLFLLAIWGMLGLVQCQSDATLPQPSSTSEPAPVTCPDSRAQPLIAAPLGAPKANPAGEARRYTWLGQAVWVARSFRPNDYVKVNDVSDYQLRYVGAPSGGFAGRGDGKCPGFETQATDGCRLWRDPR